MAKHRKCAIVQKSLGIRARERRIAAGPEGEYQLRESMLEYKSTSDVIGESCIPERDGAYLMPWRINNP